MDKSNIPAIEMLKRIAQLRAEILNEYPFFGRLLLHLIPAAADCGTACTDMTHLAFDPSFAKTLSDEEMKFVMLHEVMHCVLKHCVRGKALNTYLYNVACDIVVNSLIFESMGVSSFTVAGEEPMHLTSDGQEGRFFTAEEVYDMLNKANTTVKDNHSSKNTFVGLDNHDIWKNISDSKFSELSDKWEANIKKSSKQCSNGTGIPFGIKRYLAEINHMSRTNWKAVLSDFIRHDKSDYTFMRRDTRFQGDIIMPSFLTNMYGDSVSNLWFCVDASGSISETDLSVIFSEILSACNQLDELNGYLAFFDTQLSDFIPFADEEDIMKIEPVGGGGTSFKCIFEQLAKCKDEDMPIGIVILTDGFATIPDESAAMGVPVLWGIVNSNIEPEWGTVMHIYN